MTKSLVAVAGRRSAVFGHSGLIIGKFLPPHTGHCYLVAQAQAQVERLTLILFTKAAEPIPGDLREGWLRELFPEVEVLRLADEGPVDFGSSAAWDFWIAAIRRAYPAERGPDVVFSSEPYGPELARRLGARHVAVDPGRRHVPISASAIRARPLAHWRFLPAPVRPYFVRRVVILGAESTWKTTLAQALAERFATAWAPEYAREYLEGRSEPLTQADMLPIACGQLAAEDRAARAANRVLICDTNLLATLLWWERYWGGRPAEIAALHAGRRYDLALLSATAGTPWVDDGLRDSPHLRDWFQARFAEELARASTPTVRLEGPFEARLAAAVVAVAQVMADPCPLSPLVR
jgi:NadR type nicotinamide-nucleotide adenylyltransferase